MFLIHVTYCIISAVLLKACVICSVDDRYRTCTEIVRDAKKIIMSQRDDDREAMAMKQTNRKRKAKRERER